MKGKDRQNQSLVIEVRVVVALGEEGLVIGREKFKIQLGNSLAVHWLGLHALTAKGPGRDPFVGN